MTAAAGFACRSAQTTDLEALLRLYSQLSSKNPALPPAVARARLDEMLGMPGLYLGIGEVEGAVVTTALLMLVPNLTRNARPFGMIENVVTDEAMRGRGFGKQILLHLMARAQAANAYKIMLMTGRTDESVIKFYESCGLKRGTKTAFEVRF